MTDKVQKIREEVERLQIELIQEKENGFGSDADDACILELQNVLTYIDSLQEEPVSEELENAVIQICQKVLKGETIVIDGYEYVVLSDAEECFKAGAQWQQEQMMSKAIDGIARPDDNEIWCNLSAFNFKDGNKCKVILINEN